MHENVQKHQDKQGSKQKKKGSIKRKRYCWTTGNVLQGEELSKRLRQELLHAYTMYYYSLGGSLGGLGGGGELEENQGGGHGEPEEEGGEPEEERGGGGAKRARIDQ